MNGYDVLIAYAVVGAILLVVGTIPTLRKNKGEPYSVASFVVGAVLCVVAWPLLFTKSRETRK